MWFFSFSLTADDRVDNLVFYKFIGGPYRLIKRDYKQPLHKSEINTYIPTTKPTMISQEKYITYSSVIEFTVQEPPTIYSLSATTPQTQYKKRPLTKRILLEYIHQDMYRCPDIHPGDTSNATQCRGISKFNPKELNDIFGCFCFIKYWNIIKASNHRNLAIGCLNPPILGYFTSIPKSLKGKSITQPTKLLKRINMDIVYG